MAVQGVNGMAIAATAAGALFIYSGIKGASVTTALRTLLSGKQPGFTNVNPVTETTFTGGGTSGGGSPGGSTTDSAIANDALNYVGHAYLYGGAPGRDGKSPWDCSSFVNWVLGHDLGIAIPGFTTYDGSTHGPATGSYLIWGGATHIKRSQVQAGDLIVGVTHMGIATSNSDYISAHDQAERTSVKPISTFPDAVFSCLRVKAAS
jgi:cell wall-associated NlpC family hydrolase